MNSTRKRLTLAKPVSLKSPCEGALDAAPQTVWTEAPPYGERRPNAEPSESTSTAAKFSDVSQGVPLSCPAASYSGKEWCVSPDAGKHWTIDFGSGKTPKRLARKLQKAVIGWGDTILYTHALIIVARMFGHENYDDMQARFELANPSQSDAEVSPEERAGRFRQYIKVLSENDFSVEEAQSLVTSLRVGPWLDFAGKWDRPAPSSEMNRPQHIGTEFRDVKTAERLFRVFKKSLKAQSLTIEDGPRRLFARLFGHGSFGDMLAAAGLGNPSVPDFFLSPAAFDARVAKYLAVLADAGIDEITGLTLLREGYAGWFGIEDNEWESLRQPRRVNRVENGWRPRWRPFRLNELSKISSPTASK